MCWKQRLLTAACGVGTSWGFMDGCWCVLCWLLAANTCVNTATQPAGLGYACF